MTETQREVLEMLIVVAFLAAFGIYCVIWRQP